MIVMSVGKVKILIMTILLTTPDGIAARRLCDHQLCWRHRPMQYDADAKTIRPNDDNKRNNDNGFTATNFNDAI